MESTRLPSPYQQAIFDFVRNGRGSAAINAVAGSGKTWTIVNAAKLLREPSDALFCAFNVHIREELTRRLPEGMTVKTIHGIGYGCLAKALGKLGNPDSGKYRKLVEARLFSLGNAIFGDCPSIEQMRELKDAALKLIDMARVSLIDVEEPGAMTALADRHQIDIVTPGNSRRFARLVADVLEEGLALLRSKRVLDFTDMIWAPNVMGLKPDQFGFVFVDEAQDLSAAQLRLVLSCLRSGGRLIAVGDPRQAIYGFAGADTQSFRKVREAAKAIELPLSVCYRCPVGVVDLAQGIVPAIQAAPGAPKGTVGGLTYRGLFQEAQPGDLILSRRTAPLMRACMSFLAAGRPAKVRGKEIGQVLLRWLDEAAGLDGFSFSQLATYLDNVAFRRLSKISEKDPSADAKRDNVQDQRLALDAILDGCPATTLRGVREYIESLFADHGNVIWLSSIHRAKGLEAKRVFVLEYDKLPMRFKRMTPEQADQEDNLLYVAITRSLDELYLVYSEIKRAEIAA